jgi:mannosylglycerate hydrolase
LSAFKKAEHSDGYIVRVFNPYLEKNATAHITYSESAHYELVSLDERSKGETLVSSDTEGAQLPELQHCKLLTVLVTPELN